MPEQTNETMNEPRKILHSLQPTLAETPPCPLYFTGQALSHQHLQGPIGGVFLACMRGVNPPGGGIPAILQSESHSEKLPQGLLQGWALAAYTVRGSHTLLSPGAAQVQVHTP